jgi:allophanate hydrolase
LDAQTVFQVARGPDTADPYSRIGGSGAGAAPWSGGRFRFGVPAPAQLEFFGDQGAAELFQLAVAALEAVGGERVEIDYGPFQAAAELLYAGPWVAERLAAIQPFLDAHAHEMHPVVREIIAGGRAHSAVKTFQAAYELQKLRARSLQEWAKMDVLVLPTGYYTNFVNLLDLSAIAVPAGFRPNGLPFGISLIAPAFQDQALLLLADRYYGHAMASPSAPPGCIAVAVVGAHLSGQPLNSQLIERGARLMSTRRTASCYRLFDLSGQKPAKPGLQREDGFDGPGIEVEVWAVPENHFGSFVAAIPAPLGIGTVELENGDPVKCFICEPWALAGAKEITEYGGWRNYLSQERAVPYNKTC